MAYPTDSSYALGWVIGNKDAAERVQRIRRTDKHHNFTLICRDLSDIATYARVGNSQYRLLKSATPGSYTFILRATREVPRRLQHPKRKTVGIRIPDHPIVQALLDELGLPLMSSTLMLPDSDAPMNDPQAIHERLGSELDLVIDGGPCRRQATTVVDLTDTVPVVIREGRGDTALFA